jgi:polyhydroxyalkanoate synthesis regulator phasin
MERVTPLPLKMLQDRLAGTLLKLMENERTRSIVVQALTLYQKGIGQLSAFTEDLLHAFGFATKSDLQALESRIARLEKEIRELSSGGSSS